MPDGQKRILDRTIDRFLREFGLEVSIKSRENVTDNILGVPCLFEVIGDSVYVVSYSMLVRFLGLTTCLNREISFAPEGDATTDGF